MKYCERCGQKMLDEESFCPACGAPTASEIKREKQEKALIKRKKARNESLCVIAGVVMIATCLLLAVLAYLGFALWMVYVFFFFIFLIASAYGGNEQHFDWNFIDPRIFLLGSLIPILWIVPMAIVLFVKAAKGAKISMAFKICTLIFCSVPAGIILLFVKDEED